MPEQIFIESIILENFGLFEHREVKFDRAINQVTGPNDCGKTTIAKSILAAIYCPAKIDSLSIYSEELISSKTRLCLTFVVGELEYNLVRDYQTNTNELSNSKGELFENGNVDEELSRIFQSDETGGIEAFFFISSNEIFRLDSNIQKLQAALEGPIFREFNRVAANKYIASEIEKLENSDGPDEGILESIAQNIRIFLKKRAKLDEQFDYLNNRREEWRDIGRQVENYIEEISELKKGIIGAKAYRELSLRMDDLESRLNSHLAAYSRASQIADDLGRIENELKRLVVPNIEEMDNLKLKRKELSEAAAESKQAMDDYIVLRNNSGNGFVISTLVLVLVCLAYVLENNGNISIPFESGYLLFSILPLSVFWLLNLIVHGMRQFVKSRLTSVFRKEVSVVDEFYSEVNSHYKLKSADPVSALEDERGRKHILEVSQVSLQKTLDHLSEEKGMDYLTKLKNSMENELAEINNELIPLTKYAVALNRLPDMEEKLTAKTVRMEAAREQMAILGEECKNIKDVEEKINKNEENAEKLKRYYHNVSEKLEALKITRIALNKAANLLIEGTYQEFGSEISSFIRQLTRGKYVEIRLSRETLQFEMKQAGSSSWQGVVAYFSDAAKDCACFSIWLAANMYLSREFSPPLIIDGIDSCFDIMRKREFIMLLKELAGSRQILFITPEKSDLLPDSNVIEIAEYSPASVLI